jgi:hypothetical protein
MARCAIPMVCSSCSTRWWKRRGAACEPAGNVSRAIFCHPKCLSTATYAGRSQLSSPGSPLRSPASCAANIHKDDVAAPAQPAPRASRSRRPAQQPRRVFLRRRRHRRLRHRRGGCTRRCCHRPLHRLARQARKRPGPCYLTSLAAEGLRFQPQRTARRRRRNFVCRVLRATGANNFSSGRLSKK